MPRYALKVEYDGRPFAGWQRQAEQVTVQGAIETAIGRLTGETVRVHGAGRTDARVDAIGQAAQCDMAREWAPFRLSEALNYHLKPQPVAIVACAAVGADWHARFSAIERRYTYRVISRRAPLVHARGQAWQVKHALDPAAMAEAAQVLVGRHDFTTFRAVQCQAKSPVKTLDEIRVETSASPQGMEIAFHLRARSFLHNQVRSIVGTLERVGAGAWDAGDVRAALEAADRAACGPVAPPEGLYLTGVGYPVNPFAGAHV